MRLLRRTQYPVIPWNDGHGIAFDVARHPQTEDLCSNPIVWQLVLADITRNCDFSPHENYDYTFTVIEGAGVFLEHEDSSRHAVDRLFIPVSFPGERKTACTLLGDRALTFNLLVRRDAAHAAAEIHAITPDKPLSLPQGKGLRALVCLAGNVNITRTVAGTVALDTLDTLVLDDAPALSVTCSSNAELFVADITYISQPAAMLT